MDQITIGIVAGLITTFIVVVLRQIWIGIIQPWYENRVYQDAEIEGKWHGSYKDTEDGEELITIKRTGHKITGTITTINGADKGKKYIFTGSFNNLILTAAYSAKDVASLDRGTYSLMLVNNGTKLVGHAAFYEDTTHKIITGECTWERN